MTGEEAVFTVLSLADDWLQESWSSYVSGESASATATPLNALSVSLPTSTSPLNVCRHLIYSHHIIGKTKRSDMKSLASELKLTGYCKIGWPGIIIIEGEEAACHSFYDHIRRWNWQFLVLRGEMLEPLLPGNDLDAQRKFDPFHEVEDMSIVASHCRKVNLESLFLTSMKVYDSKDALDQESDVEALYGALVHVDHMNSGKGYRKWLRKACNDLGVALLLQQCYRNEDFASKRPLILVGLVGRSAAVSSVLKKWRTSLVDVDSRGQPCRERMMTILTEESIQNVSMIRSSCLAWDDRSSESQLNTTNEKLMRVMESTGIQTWVDALLSL